MIQKYIPQKVHQNQRQLRFARWLQKKLIKEKIRMLQGKTVIWLSFFQTPLKNSLNYFLKRSQQMSFFCLLLPLHSPFCNSRVFTLGFVRYGISYEVYKQSMRKCYIWEKNRKQDEMAQLQFHDDISKSFFFLLSFNGGKCNYRWSTTKARKSGKYRRFVVTAAFDSAFLKLNNTDRKRRSAWRREKVIE